MVSRKKYLTAGLVMLIAAASGHLVQRGSGFVSRQTVDSFDERPAAAPAPVVVAAGPAVATPVQPAPAEPPAPAPVEIAAVPVPDPAELATPEVAAPTAVAPAASAPVTIAPVVAEARDIAPDPAPVVEVTRNAVITETTATTLLTEPSVRIDPPRPDVAAQDCDIGFTATSAPAAMVDLVLEAPCRAGNRVKFEHAGLRFTEETDANGMVRVIVPALVENAVFAARFEDGETVQAEIFMPTAAEYLRVALQWTGNDGFQLHAFENGAAYGAEGDISSLSPESPARATDGKGGYLTVLGSVLEGDLADVYSYPRALSENQVAPGLSIEVEIGDNNCGREIEGIFLTNDPLARDTRISMVSMMVPDCAARGEFLVLKNPVLDLKIAAN